MKQIIMIAAENDSLIGGKVGGLADVIRDLPNALAEFGFEIKVITPAYGFLHKENPSKFLIDVHFPFGGKSIEGKFFEVSPKIVHKSVTHLVFEHPAISGDPIYSQDPLDQPFAQDATKYALFCSAVGQYLKRLPSSSTVHLHDWHMGTMFLLRELHPEFIHLKNLRHVFTIHNLGYQGNRPINGKQASVKQWFPELFNNIEWIEKWKDHRYEEPQFTPLAAGIRFADKVNTVSPSYVEEILKPSDHENGFYGGEGLEQYLQEAKREDRLSGILNAIEYPPHREVTPISFSVLFNIIITEINKEDHKNSEKYFDLLVSRIKKYRMSQPKVLLTSVTRVTEQKVRLLFEKGSDGKYAVDKIMETLDRENGFYLLLGNGIEEFEEKCIKAFKQHERLIYLKLYSPPLAQALYANGTLFLMPSLFEPCGISQMIAMQSGQPCIVHATGGLKDTVIDGVNGFQFSGTTTEEMVDGLCAVTKKAINIYTNNKMQWGKIKLEASIARFEWKESAKKYIEDLYKKKD
jgi:starch synthase